MLTHSSAHALTCSRTHVLTQVYKSASAQRNYGDRTGPQRPFPSLPLPSLACKTRRGLRPRQEIFRSARTRATAAENVDAVHTNPFVCQYVRTRGEGDPISCVSRRWGITSPRDKGATRAARINSEGFRWPKRGRGTESAVWERSGLLSAASGDEAASSRPYAPTMASAKATSSASAPKARRTVPTRRPPRRSPRGPAGGRRRGAIRNRRPPQDGAEDRRAKRGPYTGAMRWVALFVRFLTLSVPAIGPSSNVAGLLFA